MAAHRVASLPLGLRLSLSSSRQNVRYSSRWTHQSFQSFFARARPSPVSWRNTIWIITISGGLTLYISPRPKSLLPALFASPALIPCSNAPPSFTDLSGGAMIASPAEPHQPFISCILTLLREHIWEPLLTTRRFIHLFYLFAPVIITMPMLLIGRLEKRYQGTRWGALWWYGFLVRRMEAAGPTFIKLAQWAATRADLFPSILCNKMGAMHSHATPHAFSHTKRIIEDAFQRPFEEIFEEFDAEPIGTGAIAQVYRATLKRDLIPPSYLGPKRHSSSPTASIAPVILRDPPPHVPTASVAIKVLHPRVTKMIAHDLAIMSFFARIISLFPDMEWLSLPDEVEVFGDMMHQQLDLRHEAENLSIFENNFAHRNVPVTFPRPLQVFSARNVLVEEYENALPLEYFLKNGGGPFDEQMATVGLDAFLNMLLLDNFVHSDLHPGNIMIKFTKPPTTRDLIHNIVNCFFEKHDSNHIVPTTANQHESDAIVTRLQELQQSPPEWRDELQRLSDAGHIPEIVFIDAGLVTTLDATNRRNFLDLFRAVAEFDGYHTGMLMVERSRTPELAVDRETFALKMQHIVLSVKRKTFSLGQIKISDILTEVLKAVREHHVKMEGAFINTVISILLLEGIGQRLDPDLDLFKSALPILRQLGRQMTAQESMTQLPSGNFGALLKVWVWLEARQLASAAILNIDDSVKYDWLVPSV